MADPVSTAETDSSNIPQSESGVPVTEADILLPPSFGVLLLLTGLLYLYFRGKRHLLRPFWKWMENGTVRAAKQHAKTYNPGREPNHAFFDDFDLEVIEKMYLYPDNCKELFRILFPALLSLVFCPVTLFSHPGLTLAFWPDQVGQPDINNAIACYLMPAGLVYATTFGFAFQQVLVKQADILTRLQHEVSLLGQIVVMTGRLSLPVDRLKTIYKSVKAETVFMMMQIQGVDTDGFNNQPQEDYKFKLWEIIDILREVPSKEVLHVKVDEFLVNRVIQHVLDLNAVCFGGMSVFAVRMHPLKWVFLEFLGFASFFGVLLLRAESAMLELCMCLVTVFSITFLCYIVADLDSPFSGFFKIDIEPLMTTLDYLENAYCHLVEEHRGQASTAGLGTRHRHSRLKSRAWNLHRN